jgi:hypothetical protein
MVIFSIQALSRRAWETVQFFLLQNSKMFRAISLSFPPSSQGACQKETIAKNDGGCSIEEVHKGCQNLPKFWWDLYHSSHGQRNQRAEAKKIPNEVRQGPIDFRTTNNIPIDLALRTGCGCPLPPK